MKIPFTNMHLQRVRGGFALRSAPGAGGDSWFKGFGTSSDSGIYVSEIGALNLSTVFACVRVLSETLASLPLIMYERNGRSKKRLLDHPYYDLLHNVPNPEMTSSEFRIAMMIQECLWGQAFAAIDRPGAMGQARALYPLLSQYMTVKRNESNEVMYDYKEPKRQRLYGASEILHLRALTLNGIDAISPIACARNSLGLSLAMEKFGSKFFKNGARATGVATHPGELKQATYERIRDSIEKNITGENTLGFLLFEDGMTWEQLSINPDDAQFLESRAFQVPEICRWFRVQPHLIQHLDRSTNNNIEHQGLEFVVFTMRHWFVHWEQRLAMSLLTPEERKKYYFEFLVDGLLRGDLASRYSAYAVGRNWGWLSADDILELENRNPLPDNKGIIYLQPLNMVEAGTPITVKDKNIQIEEEPEPPEEESQEEEKPPEEKSLLSHPNMIELQSRFRSAYYPLFIQAGTRTARRQVQDIQHKKFTDIPELISWIEKYYNDFGDMVLSNAKPLFNSYAELIYTELSAALNGGDDKMPPELIAHIDKRIDLFAMKYIEQCRKEIKSLVSVALNQADIEKKLADWERKTGSGLLALQMPELEKSVRWFISESVES